MKRIILLISFVVNVKCFVLAQKDPAFQRNSSIVKGINVSWLENIWNPDVIYSKRLKESDFLLINKLGFKTIRLPVAFETFYLHGSEQQKKALLSDIDYVIGKCLQYKLNLILVNHSGILKKETFDTDAERLNSLWVEMEKRFRGFSREKLFFELFNEPTIADELWLPLAAKVVASIRKGSPNRTVIIGASNYNSIYELSRIRPLQTKNIIYTFHFYEPFIFTHQGAEWIGRQVSTVGIPFPYSASQMPPLNPQTKGTAGEKNYQNYLNEGKEGAITDKLNIVASWAARYHVPVLCGEYGAYRKNIPEKDLAYYLFTVRKSLDRLQIPGIIWDYNQNFSIFRGTADFKNMSPQMQKAIGYLE